MSLFDAFNEPSYPDIRKPKAYSPAEYQGVNGSGLYNALMAQAATQAAQQHGNTMRSASQYGGAAPTGLGANQEMAQRAALGNMQPQDERFKQAQYGQYLGGLQNQDAWDKSMYDSQMRQKMGEQGMIGDAVGMAAGAGLGYMGDRKAGKARAKTQRSNTPYGPINNKYSQGW